MLIDLAKMHSVLERIDEVLRGEFGLTVGEAIAVVEMYKLTLLRESILKEVKGGVEGGGE